MKKDKFPKEMLKSRTKTWLNGQLPTLLETIPPRHRKVLGEIKLTKIKYPLSCTYLCGKARTGKTIQAYQIALEWHREQYIRRLSRDYSFISVTELLAELRSSYSDKNPKNTETLIMNKYKKVNLLILDDFGAEKTTEWAYQMLYMILCHRYDYEKTTVYTSNLTLEELSKKLGDDRIPSRIGHECKGNISVFTNKPYI